MLDIIKHFKNWIEGVDYPNEDDRLKAYYVQVMALVLISGAILSILTYAIVGQFQYVTIMVLNLITYSMVLALVRNKKLHIGSNLLLVSTLFILTFGIASAGGIHASSAILFPVLLIFASLLLDRTQFTIYAILTVINIGSIIVAENKGLTPPYSPDPPNLPLFISYALMVGLTALFVRFLTENLQTALEKSRKRKNELVMQSEILNRVGHAVVACDNESNVLFWNNAASAYYGWSEKDAIGKKYHEVIPVKFEHPGDQEIIRQAIQDGEIWNGELNIRSKDGSDRIILGTLSPLHDSSGKRIGWTGIGTDIQELKDAQDKVNALNAELESRVQERTSELETAVKELESFSYTIAHDLRTPLRGINGFSSMILEDHGHALPEDAIDQINRIKHSARTMGELVDALLNFSRLIRTPLNRSHINLSEMIKETLSSISAQTQQKQPACIIAENIFIFADPKLMQIAINHMVDNACKFTSKTEEPQIEFGKQSENGNTVYFLRDNGIGFKMDYIQKLFQPFHRLHHPEEFPGHGIGLVTAQRILQRHGGKIWAESKPGHGTTFFFTLEEKQNEF